MKLSFRNLAMGAALAVSSFAFAQGTPTVTEVFNRTVTSADFGGVSMGEIRCATGVNGVVYALDKSTGKIWAITADATSVYATVDVNHGENADHVTTAITSDDAGNLVVGYANGDFFANATVYFAIVPADGSEVIYTDPLTLPADFEINRCDVIGRILGDVLSAEGAYMYISGSKSGKNVACYYISEGVFTPEEYVSDPYVTDMANMNSVVPVYNTMDEQSAVDPLYNGGVFFPWNGAGPEVLDADGNASQVGRPADLAYSAVPGGDVITYGGKTYYAINYTRTSGKRTGDFVIYDEELNVVFKTENTVTDDYISGAFLNGGAIVAHPVSDGKFQLHFWGGPQSQVVAAVYEVCFVEEPAPLPVLYVRGDVNEWGTTLQMAMSEAPDEAGFYHYSVTVPAASGAFKIADEAWGVNFGAETDCVLANGVAANAWFNSSNNFNFPVEGLDYTIEFVYNPETAVASQLTLTWTEPEPEPVKTLLLDATSATACDDWTLNVVSGPETVWSWKSYKEAYYLNASAYVSGTANAAEAWAISPVINLDGNTTVTVSFEHAAKFQTTLTSLCGVAVREVGATEWTMLTIPTWPEAGSWTFVSSGDIDLSSLAGKKIQLAFKYGSTAEGADTWEIRNLTLASDNTIVIGGEPTPTLPVLYVRGDVNEWGTTLQMAMSEAPDEAGLYHYSVTVPAASGAFKIADDAWGVNFGAETGCVLANGVAANAWSNSSNNFAFPVEGLDYTIEFVYNPDTAVASQLTLTWTEPDPTPEFPITTVFNRTVTSADFGGVSMGEIRCATGVNGVVYALDKSTGKIWAITADATSVYATVDVNHGENADHVTTAITSDDAGNLVVGYANGDFFANATIYFAIVPADGSEVIYTDPLELPADFAINRCDVIGRILGDVLSAEGAYMYISGNGSGKNVACFYISEGVFTPEEYASDAYITDMQNMNAVVPMYNTMDEQSAVDPLYNGGVFFPWNGAGPEVLDADGNASQVGRPADLAYSAVPGGDVITYGGKTYYIINYTRTAGKRTGDFVIYDEELNVVFKTENTVTDDYISGAFLNGGAIVAHPVGDGKFQLHFWGGPQSQVVASVYEIDLGGSTPEPTPTTPELIYLVGAPSNWTAPEAANAEFYASNWALAEETRGSGIYTGSFAIPNGAGMFRFYSALEGWEANSLGASASGWEDVDVAFTDGVYNGSIYAGKGNFNFTSWAGGYMDFTINLNDNTINIVAHEVYTAPTLFVRGEFDTWGEGYPMEGPSEIDAEGLYHYSATVPAFTGEFKLATADWKVSYGRGETVPAIENGVAVDTWFNGSNLVFEGCEAENITIDFALNPENSIASKLTLSWEVPVPAPARNNYAYDIALTDNGEGKYVITYKATGAGNANLLLTNVATQEVTVVELDPAVEGENTVNFDAAILDMDTEYNFAISIDNTEVTEPVLVYTGEAFANKTRGGMVVINDTESDAFGMAVACAGKAQGFQVYDQNFNLLGTYHAGDSHYNAGNQSSPFRGAARNGLAVFGDWSDAGSNYTVIDPLNPTELNFMLGEPAVKDAAGCWTLEGVEIAGGNSGHVFVGNGDDTLMFTLVEDNSAHANTLAKYELGASPVILEAPVLWMTNATPYLPNLNLQMAAADNGLFITQIRQNPDETGVCRLLYVDFNDDVKKTWWNDVIPTASGAVALNADKSVLAVGTQTSILFFDVAISEDNEPTLTKKDWEIALATDFAEFSFDVAGNLYVYSRAQQGVLVYALPFAQPAVTAAKVALVIKGAGSGVENISLEAADANAVYFTVGGVRVAADALTPGIYVKVVGNTATKVVVK